jgi:hypothetical protein
MRRHVVLIGVSLFLTAVAGAGCGGGTMSTGTAGSSGSAGSGAGTAGGGGGTTGTAGTTGSGGTGGGGPFLNVGVCGWSGKATASATAFDGYEDRFILSDEGLGAPVCVVRYDFKKVNMTPPGGCTECEWTHVVEYSNPRVMTDTNGVCANSELAFTAAKIQSFVGMRISIGFARELGGAHGSAMMKYDTAMQKWDVFGNATFDQSTGQFNHDYRDGICNY